METFRLSDSRGDVLRSLFAGAAFAFVLFLVIALAQMIGVVSPPSDGLEETVVAFQAPEVIEIEQEEEPPPPEEEPEPEELEPEPPQLSLDQLDIALHPGTGGSLAGDFALPSIASSHSQRDLGTEDFVDFSDLDQVPRPIGVSGFNFPRRLLSKKVSGRVILLLKLDEKGEVIEVRVGDSNLPDFDDFIVGEVRGWRFTPPTKQGLPVKAQARLPIPIHIN